MEIIYISTYYTIVVTLIIFFLRFFFYFLKPLNEIFCFIFKDLFRFFSKPYLRFLEIYNTFLDEFDENSVFIKVIVLTDHLYDSVTY